MAFGDINVDLMNKDNQYSLSKLKIVIFRVLHKEPYSIHSGLRVRYLSSKKG
jgi:hypothetical protein